MAEKAEKAEIDRRVTEIYSLILSCYSREKICQYAAKKWGISYRSTDRLIQRARSRMMEITAIKREEAYAEEMELRREIIRKALDDKKYQTALQAADSRAKLRGLFEPLSRAIETVIDYGGTVDFTPNSADKNDSKDGESEGGRAIPLDTVMAGVAEIEPTIIPTASRNLEDILTPKTSDRIQDA